MNRLQNNCNLDVQRALATETSELDDAQTEAKNEKVAEASVHEEIVTKQGNIAAAGQQGQQAFLKDGFIAGLEKALRNSGQIVGDQFFRVMVKLHPTKALRNFNENAKLIRRSELFDYTWYRAQYKKQIRPTQDPVFHYLQEGAALGFNPSASFDTMGYVELHPDLASSKLNPLVHHVRTRKRKKHDPSAASCSEVVDGTMRHCALQLAPLEPSKKTVLLVTHDMSRTGAPILLLNIAKQLRQQFNVIILTLKDGILESEFSKGCDLLIGPTIPVEHLHSERFLTLLFQRLASEHSVTFAVINSIMSYVVLKSLWKNDIPSIHLIHEFATNTRPRGLFRESAFYSSLQIFSAAVVRDDVARECPEIHTEKSIILPQGINTAPGITGDPEAAAAERQHIRDLFRPVEFPRDTVVVLGGGTVHVRKGVDLFVACAKRVVEKHPSTPFRFVWIGSGYKPEEDDYSLFLADQIRRSGLNEILTIAKEVAEIETAHQDSDILFLSSRLDPLPQVSQVSMANGKPVVCFEGATGIAEYLAEDPDAAMGVIPYLDIEQAATCICRLIDEGSYRRQVGEACRRLAASRFSFAHYIRRIEAIGLEQVSRQETEKTDRALIRQSNLFRPDFCGSPAHCQTLEHCLRHYMSLWRSGIGLRKPFPGFHPGIYAECNHIENRDPLSHYIEAGQPEGPWRYQVIEDDGSAVIGKPARVALHLHLYFSDLAEEIFDRLKTVQTKMDLLISVPSAEMARRIGPAATQFSQGKPVIRIVPNLGRDIGPFLTEFREIILGNYDIIGHLHTKRSVDVDDRAIIKRWTNFLYENLLGGQKGMADTIISQMISDKTIGLVFPDDPHVIGWGKNWDHAVALTERLNIPNISPKASMNFPVGTMFWARTAALRPLFDLGLQWDDYPPEPLPYDGSMLHAIERMLPIITKTTGFRSVATHVDGVTR